MEVVLDDGTLVVKTYSDLDEIYLKWAEVYGIYKASVMDKALQEQTKKLKEDSDRTFAEFLVHFDQKLPEIYRSFMEDRLRSMAINIVGVTKEYLVRIVELARKHKIYSIIENTSLVLCSSTKAAGKELKPENIPEEIILKQEFEGTTSLADPNSDLDVAVDLITGTENKITKDMIQEFRDVPDPVVDATILEILPKDNKIGLKINAPECYGSPIIKYVLQIIQRTFTGLVKEKTVNFWPTDIHFLVEDYATIHWLTIRIKPENASGEQKIYKELKLIFPKIYTEIKMMGRNEINQIDYDLIDEIAQKSIDANQEENEMYCGKWATVSFVSTKSNQLKPARILSKNSTLCIVDNFELVQWGLALGLEKGSVVEQPAIMFLRKGLLVNSIALGNTFCVVSTIDGKVFSWGDNRFGQLGNGTYCALVPNPVQVSDLATEFIVDVRAGFGFTLSLSDKGKAFSWGQKQAISGVPVLNRFGDEISFVNSGINQPSPQDISSKYIQSDDRVCKIAAGEYHLGLVTEKGHIFLWGDNEENMFGDYPASNSVIPIKIPLKTGRAVALELGYNHSVLQVETSDDSGNLSKEVYAWGINKHYQCGLPNPHPVTTPTLVPSLKGLSLNHFSCGVERTFFTTTEGKTFMFGRKARDLLEKDSLCPVELEPRGKEVWEFNGTFVIMN